MKPKPLTFPTLLKTKTIVFCLNFWFIDQSNTFCFLFSFFLVFLFLFLWILFFPPTFLSRRAFSSRSDIYTLSPALYFFLHISVLFSLVSQPWLTHLNASSMTKRNAEGCQRHCNAPPGSKQNHRPFLRVVLLVHVLRSMQHAFSLLFLFPFGYRKQLPQERHIFFFFHGPSVNETKVSTRHYSRTVNWISFPKFIFIALCFPPFFFFYYYRIIKLHLIAIGKMVLR